jgi:lipopolysaccharide transport system permease protein
MRDEIVLEAGRSERHYWLDLWRYRELFRVLAWRDLSVRYKQTVIGVLWVLIRPFLTMVIVTIIFGRIAKLPTDGNAHYALMVFAGILPWTLFSAGLSETSNSLITNASLISKVYFPRLIIPVASIVVAYVDFLISFGILLLLMGWYRFAADWRIIALPGFGLLAFFAIVGPALWIAALNVKYRDFRCVIPFIVQLGPYLSPAAQASCRRNGACCIRLIRWWGDSPVPMVHTARAKRSILTQSVGRHCRNRRLSVVRGASIPKDGKSFADLI